MATKVADKAKKDKAKARKGKAREVGARFIAGMQELIATAKAGGQKAVDAKYASRVDLRSFQLPALAAADVTAARAALGVGEDMFALILGVPVQSVQAWERGTKPPPGPARRLIAEIRATPDHWRQRFGLGTAAAEG